MDFAHRALSINDLFCSSAFDLYRDISASGEPASQVPEVRTGFGIYTWSYIWLS